MSLLVNIRKKLGSFTLDVAFESEGGVLGLLGPSGCGKSMTLKCIAGVETPDSGKIVLDGVTLFDSQRRINLPPQQRQVGFLFQNYALFPNMTVRQNILCGLCREKDRSARERACQEAISLLQLEGLERHKPRQLSGGQQQRVALARILVGQPKLLLLDEPFSALDSHLRLHLQMEMKRLLGEFGRDVLLVTHSRDEAYHLAQSIAVLENGRLCTMKETKALFADPESRAAAALTGCKNLYSARKCSSHLVEVPELGLRLTTPKEVRDGLTAIGIRAHDFSPEERENQFPICLDSEMEEPFERIVRFRYPNQSPDSEPVWWRFSKEIQPASMPEALGVAGDALLLFYDESF